MGVKVRREVPIKVYYKGSLNNLHIAQCLNYFKASGLSLCLLINFGSPVQVKRIVNNF
jgi:hypothetical protein